MIEEFKALVPFWFNHLYVEAGETFRALPAQIQYIRHVVEDVVAEVKEAATEIREAVEAVPKPGKTKKVETEDKSES